MVCVIEYGEHIGTLKNLFRDLQQAIGFVQQIMEFSENYYECIGENQWHCPEKNEYVKIENA
jgi:hypothetical protein